MGLTVSALPRASGLEVPASALGSLCSTPQTPKAADRDGLILDVGKESPVAIPLQSLLDKGPEDDLEAHRQLERGRRPSREDASLPKHVLGENEKHSGLIRKHRHLRILRARSHASRQPHRHYIMLSYYITYTMIYLARC